MDWKKLIKKLLYLPIWLMIVLGVLSTVALISVFVRGMEKSVLAYVVYVVSFYTLSVIVIFCIKVLPKQYREIKKKIYGVSIFNRYLTDAAFKTHVNLYLSLSVNLLYVAINLFFGIWYGSVWFITLAVYYIILAGMRFLLVKFVNENGLDKNRDLELRRSQFCSGILLTLNLALSGVVVLVIRQDEGFQYPGLLIYVMAAYTFYITTLSIINMIKFRKYKNPIMSTAKIITFAAALVSMLSLETAMLSEFGAETEEITKLILIAATGAGVCVTVVVMALYVIVRSKKELKKGKGSDYEKYE